MICLCTLFCTWHWVFCNVRVLVSQINFFWWLRYMKNSMIHVCKLRQSKTTVLEIHVSINQTCYKHVVWMENWQYNLTSKFTVEKMYSGHVIVILARKKYDWKRHLEINVLIQIYFDIKQSLTLISVRESSSCKC
jgi:hypothetical protein